MTYGAMLAASFVRSLAVVLAGLVGAEILAAWVVKSPSPAQRRWRIAVVAAPFLIPNLVVGFGYRGVSLGLLIHPWINELLYFLLVCFETTPAAVWLLLHSAPPAISSEAVHCARLAAAKTGSMWSTLPRRFGLWRRGSVSRWLGPAAILFLLSFQESELASLMQVRSWTERIFTEATRGLPPRESVKLVAAPALIQSLALIPLFACYRSLRSLVHRGIDREAMRPHCWLTGRFGDVAAWIWILGASLLVIGHPTLHMLRNAWTSGRTVLLQPRWIRELSDAVLLASTCAVVAWAGTMLAQRRSSGRASPVRHRLFAVLLTASVLPGLMGSLALGLIVAAMFQRFLPEWAYTPLPLVLAELLWLWPRALVVHGALGMGTALAVHSVRLLDASSDVQQQRNAWRLWWGIAGRGLLGGVFLVWWWSYLEVMLPELLRTSGFQPAPWFLYNHLHFGQIPALGVKLVLILSVPAAVLSLTTALLRRLAR